MNLNDYFDPVSLEKPEFSYLKADNTISHTLSIHTPDVAISGIEDFDMAIFGVKEDRNAFIKGSASAPDRVREKLYLLSEPPGKARIIDLGNLKNTGNIEDTYYALRDILSELIKQSVVALIIGGSQDLGLGLARYYEEYNGFWNFTTIDSRIDFENNPKKMHSGNYLGQIAGLKSQNLLNLTNLGHQVYFTPLKRMDEFENRGHLCKRLGVIRSNMKISEPFIRDSDILSIDINAIRQSDAPAGSCPSPNGFFSYELCQLTRYAGATEKLKAVLFSELIPDKDQNEQTSNLIAQAIWYFFEGYSIRKPENPREGNVKKFIVSTSAADQNMIFYKSNETDRWWMEIPVKDPLTNQYYIISCAYEDYQLACTNEIPDRWWNLMRRFS
ncbi:MAG: formimidoylglutamase [Bacteroidota bacterium]